MCFLSNDKNNTVFFKACIQWTGEHVLSFAACAGNEDIISMVIDAGASTRVQDYRGMKYFSCRRRKEHRIVHPCIVLIFWIINAICLLFLYPISCPRTPPPPLPCISCIMCLGNTVLHILVLQPNKTIACQAIDLIMARDAELDQSVTLDMVPNYRGLTPFKLAAKEGNIVVSEAWWEVGS